MHRLMGALFGAGILISPISAMAADMPVKAAQALPPVPFTWTGLYLGAHLGGAWAKTQWTSDFNCAVGILCENVEQRPSGPVGGLQLGYRYQTGPWVFGVEGTAAFANIKKTDPSTCTPGVATCIGIPGGFGVVHTIHVDSLFTGTGQIGYAWDRTLWYAKGGWAGGEVKRQSADLLGSTAATFFNSVTQHAHGWTVGGGVELMAFQNLSIGLEYDYFRLKDAGFTDRAISGTGVPNFFTYGSPVDVHLHQVVLRASYKFDWGKGPVVAKY
jgi:outer membrane immunogenic protein